LTLLIGGLYNFFVAACGRERNRERSDILFGTAIYGYDFVDYTD
jgi:hypothetical protein